MEHRLIVEKYLGRYLAKIEAVHHIDRATDHNEPKNLMAFKNHAAHLRFEGGTCPKSGDIIFDGRLLKH
jgi:hypothetical protein